MKAVICAAWSCCFQLSVDYDESVTHLVLKCLHSIADWSKKGGFFCFTFRWKLSFWSSHTVQELRPRVLISLAHAWKQLTVFIILDAILITMRLEKIFSKRVSSQCSFAAIVIAYYLNPDPPKQASSVLNCQQEHKSRDDGTKVDARIGFSANQGEARLLLASNSLSANLFLATLSISIPRKSNSEYINCKSQVSLIQYRPQALIILLVPVAQEMLCWIQWGSIWLHKSLQIEIL